MKNVAVVAKTPKDSTKSKRRRGTTNTMNRNKGWSSRDKIIKNEIKFIISNTIGSAIVKSDIVGIHVEVKECRGKKIRSSKCCQTERR